jgi:hypothetical protein
MIDLAQLGALIANILGGVAILAVVIFAAVAYLKQWGVAGKALTGSAFAVGLVVAFAARFMLLPPATLQDWLATAFMGVMAGFLATGAYKGVESATGKNRFVEGELLEVTGDGPIYADIGEN